MEISSHEEQTLFAHASGPAMDANYHEAVMLAIRERQVLLASALADLAADAEALTRVARWLVETLSSGHKVLVAGNGGSAAQAQHFAAELVGRFKRERVPYAVLALTTDTSIITAVANDYGYQDIFARQVLALGQHGDMLITFSTSGESENLVRASLAGQQRLMTIVAVTGERSSRLEQLSDMTVRAPVSDTALIQELHMIVTHILCDIVELQLSTCGDGQAFTASQALDHLYVTEEAHMLRRDGVSLGVGNASDEGEW